MWDNFGNTVISPLFRAIRNTTRRRRQRRGLMPALLVGAGVGIAAWQLVRWRAGSRYAANL